MDGGHSWQGVLGIFSSPLLYPEDSWGPPSLLFILFYPPSFRNFHFPLIDLDMVIIGTVLLPYLLTTSCRILIESWLSLSLPKISYFLHGTRRFLNMLTKVHHWPLSWASRIQFAPSNPFFLRSILMSSSHLRLDLSSGILPSDLTTKTL